MRIRVTIPVVVSAELAEQTVNGAKVYVVGTPRIEGGQYYETMDAPLMTGTTMYKKAVDAIIKEGASFFSDMEKGADHGIGPIGTEYRG